MKPELKAIIDHAAELYFDGRYGFADAMKTVLNGIDPIITKYAFRFDSYEEFIEVIKYMDQKTTARRISEYIEMRRDARW